MAKNKESQGRLDIRMVQSCLSEFIRYIAKKK
jgi:hypothetical protein